MTRGAALDPLEFRRVVGRFATGVTVVTTVLPGSGEQHALTCNSFTSVSLDPVLVLFCTEKVARFHAAVLESGQWAVSVLAASHERYSRHFAVRGRDLEDQFAEVPHVPGPITGAPVLQGSIAALECRTVSVTDAGDHSVVMGQVLGFSQPDPDGEPLLYFQGRYRSFHPLS
ncbi:MAG: flavin reductase domain protein FMN-binding protein [Frankiales bacterium]|nr:flavin reductase domain protein FMN-binding protein [Frankiales bacterium]